MFSIVLPMTISEKVAVNKSYSNPLYLVAKVFPGGAISPRLINSYFQCGHLIGLRYVGIVQKHNFSRFFGEDVCGNVSFLTFHPKADIQKVK